MKLPLFRIAALVACLCSGFSIKAQCWQSVSAGVDHTIAIRDDGSLWAWGFNGNGQLGDGTTINRSLPVQIGTDTNWKSIDAGGIFNLAIKTDGSLWAWGDGFWGQLGLGSGGIQRSSPTRVGTATDWKLVSAGREFSMALKTDGTLWAWGDNTFGQLGFVSFTSSPTKVGTATDWKTIFAASTHSLAIKNDGTLWTWGANFDGQLGDGTNNQKNTPTKIGTATDWQTISGGDGFSVAIKINGTLWAWGDNYFNQLGDGTDVNKTSPVQIGSQSNWFSIATGNRHTVAIKTDGSLWGWGQNELGQFGDATYTNKNSPTQSGTATDWQLVIAGEYHTLAFKTNGTLWSWGDNDWGKLGDGTSILRNVPFLLSTPTPTGNSIQSFCGSATVANLTVTGTNIKWYTTSTGGSSLPSTTSLMDGIHYYASQTIGSCESVYRLDVTASINTTPTPAPTGTTTQTFCGSATIANLVATGLNIKWYSGSSGGTAMASNVSLVNGMHYFASQTVNGCESVSRLDIEIEINTIAAPTGSSQQSFCPGATVNDLIVSGANIIWYSTPAGGSAIADLNSPLVNQGHYYATQTINGLESCSRFDLRVFIFDPAPPIGPSVQTLCDGTISNLMPSSTGGAILWYDQVSGGNALAETTMLVNGAHYYAAKSEGGCQSSARLDVTVFVYSRSVPNPEGTTYQTFCEGATLADFVAEGEGIKWYSEASGATLLAPSTKLIDGKVYYASQTINSVESCVRGPFVSLITTISPPSGPDFQLFCNSAQISDLNVTGENIKWYDTEIADEPLPFTTSLAHGSHYFASQTTDACESGKRLEIEVDLNTIPTPPPAGLSTQEACPTATVLSLSADGNNINWYSQPIGGSVLPPSTPLQDGAQYYASQNINTCESDSRLEVTVTINPDPAQPPTGEASQNFCGLASVADLDVAGNNIKWYSMPDGGLPLPLDASLENGMHYYATQQFNGCESSQLEVLVNLNSKPSAPTIVGAGQSVTNGWFSASAGYKHSVAIRSDGTLWAWGDNSVGQLGIGSTGANYNKNTPVQVGTASHWKSVIASSMEVAYNHALKDDGTLWTWGDNSYGHFGDGTTVSSNSPKQIGTDNNWYSISSSSTHVAAIKTDGSLWTWGQNDYGNLGDGTTDDKFSPVKIGNSAWAFVSAGAGFTLAIKMDGTLWGWGGKYLYDLENGTNAILVVDKVTPTQIGTQTTWQYIFAGDSYSFAIKDDGTLWGWGNNLYGQLGNGTTILRETPTQIGVDANWLNVTAKGYAQFNNHATKWDGSLWGWGSNESGQLGDGTNLPKTTPVQVGATKWWEMASSGYSHTLAKRDDMTLWAWGDNSYGQLGIGTPASSTFIPQMVKPPYPVVTQTHCLGATVLSLNVEEQDVQWYTSSTNSTPLPVTEPLVDGVHYFASISNDVCESDRVEVIAKLGVSIPTGASSQSFCQGATVANLSVDGNAIVWYNAPTGGAILPSSTVLTNATHYYATQTVNNCESANRLDVFVNVTSTSAPTGNSTQVFCTSGTIANLAVTGSSIKWYNAAVGGTLLPSTTALQNGVRYFASQTVNACESSARLDVLVSLTIAATPTGNATQSFCGNSNPTVANLAVIGTGIKWYTASSGGSPMPTTTTLQNGNHYYASQTINSCESQTRFHVFVSITNSATPTGSINQTFCNSANPTVANLTATGTGIKWYNSASDGSPLLSTQTLQTGVHYYASQTVNSCESSSRLDVTVSLANTNAPTGNANQVFCEGATVENLAVAGSAIKWYLSPSGGTPIFFSTFLTNATQYFATQTISNCESLERLSVTATVTPTPSAPTGDSPQILEPGMTIGDLVAIGTGIKWYQNLGHALSHNNVLSPTVPLVNDSTYYATQTISGCESITSLPVEVFLVTGSEPSDDLLSFYPSPTSGRVFLVAEKEIAGITVRNNLGQIIFSKVVENTVVEVDLSGMQSQTYFIRVKLNGRVKVIKVVKD